MLRVNLGAHDLSGQAFVLQRQLHGRPRLHSIEEGRQWRGQLQLLRPRPAQHDVAVCVCDAKRAAEQVVAVQPIREEAKPLADGILRRLLLGVARGKKETSEGLMQLGCDEREHLDQADTPQPAARRELRGALGNAAEDRDILSQELPVILNQRRDLTLGFEVIEVALPITPRWA